MNEFDITKAISKVAPGIEFHIPMQADDGSIKRASYCGPGTRLSERLENYNPITGSFTGIITPPINEMDSACLEHDVAYTSLDKDDRNKADVVLVIAADKILSSASSTSFQKFNANLIKFIINSKIKFGLGHMDSKELIKRVIQKIG